MANNYVYSTGTLTITCFIHSEYDENGSEKYHGSTKVATIHKVASTKITEILNREIESYLSRCKFRHCDRTFSWKFETF